MLPVQNEGATNMTGKRNTIQGFSEAMLYKSK